MTERVKRAVTAHKMALLVILCLLLAVIAYTGPTLCRGADSSGKARRHDAGADAGQGSTAGAARHL